MDKGHAGAGCAQREQDSGDGDGTAWTWEEHGRRGAVRTTRSQGGARGGQSPLKGHKGPTQSPDNCPSWTDRRRQQLGWSHGDPTESSQRRAAQSRAELWGLAARRVKLNKNRHGFNHLPSSRSHTGRPPGSPHPLLGTGMAPGNPRDTPPTVCFWAWLLGKPPRMGPRALESLPPAQLLTPLTPARSDLLLSTTLPSETHTTP